jgi:hypothetical protein
MRDPGDVPDGHGLLVIGGRVGRDADDMRVMFDSHSSDLPGRPASVKRGAAVTWTVRLTRTSPGGEVREIRLGHPLLDDYLRFVGARARTNTWLATAYDLKVFFSVVDKDPGAVTSADVLGFIEAQRAARADSEHVHRLVVVAWLLALHDPNLGTERWAHQLGYRGHFLTKSRYYSTTFTRLRTARARWAAWQRALSRLDPWESMRQTAGRVLRRRWQVAGFGWRLEGDALLARTVREQQRARREAAREARAEIDRSPGTSRIARG